MFSSKKLLSSSECAAAFCARAGFGIPKTPNAASARIGYLHTARMFFTFPSDSFTDSFTACNHSVIVLAGHSSLRHIENQCPPRRAERENPQGKVGGEPQHSNSGAFEAFTGERLPGVATIHRAVHVPVLDQESLT